MKFWDLTELDVEPHQPQVLRTDDNVRVIAINLPGGEELQEHQVHEHAYLVVAGGEVEVAAASGGETLTGGPGLVVHFDPAERHTVRALEDSRLVLLLAPWPGEGHPSRR